MKKDPISSIIIFYIISIPSIFFLYLIVGLTTQAGAQIPLLVLGLSAWWLPILGAALCLYFLFFTKEWNRYDFFTILAITLGHLTFIALLCML